MLNLDTELFRSILDGLHTGVYVVDPAGKVLFWNDGAERITGYLRQNMMGRAVENNLLVQIDAQEEELAGDLSPIALALRDGRHVNTRASLRHKEGHRVLVQIHTFPLRDQHGAISAAVESFEESVAISEWNRRQDKLATYGCIDATSGVLNHAMVQSHLREALGTFAEHPIPFSVLCIEIDHLADIQARDGPAAIASILRVVGQSLENSLRPTDFLGRWQDNQFLAILMECSLAELPFVAERLRRMVAASKVQWWGDPLNVSVSMGGAAASEGDTVETLSLRAEEALRASVTQGGACVTVSSK